MKKIERDEDGPSTATQQFEKDRLASFVEADQFSLEDGALARELAAEILTQRRP